MKRSNWIKGTKAKVKVKKEKPGAPPAVGQFWVDKKSFASNKKIFKMAKIATDQYCLVGEVGTRETVHTSKKDLLDKYQQISKEAVLLIRSEPSIISKLRAAKIQQINNDEDGLRY